jgi:signal transduction histidine kinase
VRPRPTRLQATGLALGAYLLLYLSWQLLHWLPGRQQLGQSFLIPADLAALASTWLATRRCVDSPRLHSFWRWMSAAMAAEAVADILLLRNVVVYRVPPFPTLADPFFLSFYVLLFLALLRVPVARATAAKRYRTLLDGATIMLGGGAIVWYFVLGPTAEAGGRDVLATAVSLAYPVGDLILLAGLAAVLLRQSPAILKAPLLLIAAGMVASIVADTIYGNGVLYGTYTSGDPVDTLYVLEFLLFALAAAAQRPVLRGEDQQAPTDDWRAPSARASWLPYLTAPIGFGLLVAVDWNKPFFPELSLVLIVMTVGGLVAARQYLALRELATTEAALRASEKLKDEFISVVGHELRTPLTSIRGSLGLLQGGVLGPLSEEAAGMLALAITNTDRLVRMINDILDIERMDAERMDAERMELELAPVKAAELVNQAVAVVQMPATQARVTIATDVEDVTVSADPDRIVQALVNLLGNAIKFSNRWGTVTIAVVPEGKNALFSVTDTGRGIPADRLETIFERFRQVDSSDSREKGGSGLGLAIARGAVERLGGRMWAESEDGHGSTFRFTLPLVDDAATALVAGGGRQNGVADGPAERQSDGVA